jgi:orotate phosphoribosyltransferase
VCVHSSYLIVYTNSDSIISISPYFFNAGLLSTGPILATLASAYASTIIDALSSSSISEFDVLFGPAYKGIPIAACTALVLHNSHNTPVGFAYDRKEVKDHGEGGKLVGVSVKGKRVVILDDVMTAGTAVRQSIELVKKEGGRVVGIVQCLDREEVGQSGVSTVEEVEGIVGVGTVKSILKMRDLMEWLKENKREAELESMQKYRDSWSAHPVIEH